ncbi:MAG: DUF998 domain-containing protein [Vicinamibacterales bacterium]
MRILALGGIGGPLLFVAVTVVAAWLRPGYSHVTSFISELGATGTPNAAFMNYAGFVPTGLMLAVFGFALSACLPRDRWRGATSALVAIFGIGVIADGFLNCDPGCPETGGSVENLLHNRIAPVAFLCASAGAAIVGLRYRHLAGWRVLSWFSLVSSAAALCFLVFLASSLESRALTGVWQRLLLTVLFTWCAVVGWRAFAARSRTPWRGRHV